MSEIIQQWKKEYGKADHKTRKKLTIAVEQEIEDFSVRLSEPKNLEPTIAHLYAVSLKS